MDETTEANAAQEACLQLSEAMTPIRDAIAGYREALRRDNGFSAEASEAMAVDYHRHVLAMIVKGQT